MQAGIGNAAGKNPSVAAGSERITIPSQHKSRYPQTMQPAPARPAGNGVQLLGVPKQTRRSHPPRPAVRGVRRLGGVATEDHRGNEAQISARVVPGRRHYQRQHPRGRGLTTKPRDGRRQNQRTHPLRELMGELLGQGPTPGMLPWPAAPSCPRLRPVSCPRLPQQGNPAPGTAGRSTATCCSARRSARPPRGGAGSCTESPAVGSTRVSPATMCAGASWPPRCPPAAERRKQAL